MPHDAAPQPVYFVVDREPALPASEPAKAKLGHREQHLSRPWRHLPSDPLPTVEELDARAARRRE